MVNAKEFFSGNFLKAEDCEGKEVFEMMNNGDMEEITTPEGKQKVLLNFDVKIISGSKNLTPGKIKTFSPNKSNGNLLVKSWGDDTDKWIGKRFQVEIGKVNVFGVMKKSIMVVPEEIIEPTKV